MFKNKKVVILSFVVFLLVAGVALSYVYYPKPKKGEVKKPALILPQATGMCGSLLTDTPLKAPAPFAPVLRANLSGSYNSAAPICEWSINSKFDHKSYPIHNQCIFGAKTLTTKGEYTISYKITGQTCSKTIKVTVE